MWFFLGQPDGGGKSSPQGWFHHRDGLCPLLCDLCTVMGIITEFGLRINGQAEYTGLGRQGAFRAYTSFAMSSGNFWLVWPRMM